MTTIDRSVLESALFDQIGSGPTPTILGALDVRVRHLMAATAAPPIPPRRWFVIPRRTLLLGIAFIALVAMAAGGRGMLDRIFSGNWPGWERAWDRSEEIGLTQVIDGHRVTVERAYMDAGQTIIGLTTDGLAYPVADLLVDSVAAIGGLSAGDGVRGQSAGVLVFRTPAGIGPVAHVRLSVGRVEQLGSTDVAARPWQFTFELPNHGGGTWAGAERVTDARVGVTLSSLRVSPTRIGGQFVFDGDPLSISDDAWTPHGWVEHGDQRHLIDSGFGGNRAFAFTIRDGVDEPEGRWTVHVTELSSDPGNPSTHIRIAGPWEFTVLVE